MRYWFQNLNDAKRYWFHFRGDFRTDRRLILKYEVVGKPTFRLNYEPNGYDDCVPQVSLGLFFACFYLSSPVFKLPFFTPGREYGFYFHEWTFRWHWGTKTMEWDSRTPKWRSFSFNILDFLFGQRERLEDQLAQAENAIFKIGEKQFVMNKIVWERNRSFRRYIPYSLYHKTWYSVQMDIEKPPMRRGKGENSWDCDDDGSFGMSRSWPYDVMPRWDNTEHCAMLAIELYVNDHFDDVRRYGSAGHERGTKAGERFEFVGLKYRLDNKDVGVCL